jgi:hypothetical protein
LLKKEKKLNGKSKTLFINLPFLFAYGKRLKEVVREFIFIIKRMREECK